MADFGISKWNGKHVFEVANKVTVEAMKKAGILLSSDVKTHFTSTTGDENALLQQRRKSVRRTKSGKRHIGSLPGEPPAVDTGNLRASIQHFLEVTPLDVVGKVGPDVEFLAAKTKSGTDVEYGYYLEIGTARMAPRPYLRPALSRTKGKVNKIFQKAFK